MPVEQIPNRFYAPEGRYALYSERHSGLQYFSSSRSTKLTFVNLPVKEEGSHVVFNVQDYLHICNYSHTGKVRLPLLSKPIMPSMPFHGFPLPTYLHLRRWSLCWSGSLIACSLRDDQCCLLEVRMGVQRCQRAMTSFQPWTDMIF